MKKILVTASLLALAFATGPASASHSMTVNYVASTPGVSLVQNIARRGDVGLGYGGYIFPAANHVPRSLRIEDVAGGTADIPVTVCQTVQDTGPSQSCGDPGTVSFDACTSASGTVSLANKGLVANVTTAVFIKGLDPLSDCENTASVGTVTMTW